MITKLKFAKGNSKLGKDTAVFFLRMITKLKFAKGNAKLEKDTAVFSLPAGHTCPAALLCQSRADKLTGKLTDGNRNVFRCYAASAENLFRNIRVSRWRNFEALQACKGVTAMVDLILRSMPVKGIKLCRIHSSGDFFSQSYFDAWLAVARSKPDVIFYAYTKALPYWIARLSDVPSNFRLVASRGGRYDSLIEAHNLRNVKVVLTVTLLCYCMAHSLRVATQARCFTLCVSKVKVAIRLTISPIMRINRRAYGPNNSLVHHACGLESHRACLELH